MVNKKYSECAYTYPAHPLDDPDGNEGPVVEGGGGWGDQGAHHVHYRCRQKYRLTKPPNIG